LGATLFHLLAGVPPFARTELNHPVKKLLAAATEPAPLVTEYRSDIPYDLVAVVDRLLAKVPADRFASAAELAEVIAPFAAGSDLTQLASQAATLGDVPRFALELSTSSQQSASTIEFLPWVFTTRP
jgi:hypothetical protein